MASQEKAKFLQARLDEQIQGFSDRRQENRRLGFGLRVAVIACGAATTVLIGFQGVGVDTQPTVKNWALFFSALVTAISTANAFYNYRALWIGYTATAEKLKIVQWKLQYLMTDNEKAVEEVKIDQLFVEFTQIMEEARKQWQQLRDAKES